MNRKAFTLIELLVVVAVLALLASIVFSNLGGAREGARISNALSFQSQTHSLLGSDLVGWWNFNEGSGTTARDISGYNNHGTINGATYVDGVPGTLGTALSFDGVNDYVDVGNDASLKLTEDMTLTAWIYLNHELYPPGTTNWEIFNSEIWQSNGFIVRIDGTSGKIYTRTSQDGTWSNITGNTTLSIYEWYYITITKGGTNGKIYLNGSLDGTGTLNNPIIATKPMTVSGPGQTFDGQIDDVRIYSRALTASEIWTLYAETKDEYLVEGR